MSGHICKFFISAYGNSPKVLNSHTSAQYISILFCLPVFAAPHHAREILRCAQNDTGEAVILSAAKNLGGAYTQLPASISFVLVTSLHISQFKQGEGAMGARRHQEVLPTSGRQKTFQAVIIVVDSIFFYQVKRSLVFTHRSKEICRGDKDREIGRAHV